MKGAKKLFCFTCFSLVWLKTSNNFHIINKLNAIIDLLSVWDIWKLWCSFFIFETRVCKIVVDILFISFDFEQNFIFDESVTQIKILEVELLLPTQKKLSAIFISNSVTFIDSNIWNHECLL